MSTTEDLLKTAFEQLHHSGLGSSIMQLDAAMAREAAVKVQEVLTRTLVDAMATDKWPDTEPRSHLETLVADLTMQVIEALMEQGLDEDEANNAAGEFMDAYVLAGRGEDDIVDNAVDRRAEDLEYSSSPASYHGHGSNDF